MAFDAPIIRTRLRERTHSGAFPPLVRYFVMYRTAHTIGFGWSVI
jgi:hypothetical protein